MNQDGILDIFIEGNSKVFMDTIISGGYKLENLGKLNILLGKNGCGKSTLLKEVEKNIRSNVSGLYSTRRLTLRIFTHFVKRGATLRSCVGGILSGINVSAN